MSSGRVVHLVKAVDRLVSDYRDGAPENRAEARAYLVRVLASQRDSRSTKGSASDTWFGLTLGIAIVSTIGVPLSCASAVFLSAYALPLIAISGFAAFFAWIVFLCLLFQRPARQLPTNPDRCRDCRYDLRRLPHVILPSELDGLLLGPRSCPECGAAYPSQPMLVTMNPA